MNTPKPTPRQQEIKTQIALQNELLVGLYLKRDNNLLSDNDRDEMKQRENKRDQLNKELRLKQIAQNITRNIMIVKF